MFECEKLNLAVLSNHVHRFAGVPMVGHRSSISEHSNEVRYYADTLALHLKKAGSELMNYKTMYEINKYASEHDLGEVSTGDVPYPAKINNPRLKEALDETEDDFLNALGIEQNYTDIVKFIVKISDAIAVDREIKDELRLGNRYLQKFCENGELIFKNTFKKYSVSVPEEILATVKDWLVFHKIINKDFN